MFQDILHLLFPRVCVTCNNALTKNENHVCMTCLVSLPQTRFHETADNPLSKIFWGRLPLEQAFSFLYFRKGSAVQHILHEIKYRKNTELAYYMGQYYGSLLTTSGIQMDAVAAIPLHRNKQRKRGYNQSALIAAGMCETMNTENLSPFIERNIATATQTKKSRFARWENVEEVFSLKSRDPFTNKKILLVDDVITTGATIEACGKQILGAANCRLSVASIAFASG